jgi:adenosylhomocysteine nucleosidase
VGARGFSNLDPGRDYSLNVAGVVAALAAEARALGPPIRISGSQVVTADGTLVAVSGIGTAAAKRASMELIAAGATALVSWGMAGALDPTLTAGTVCLPSEVISSDGRCFIAAHPWREALVALLAGNRPVTCGRLLTSSQAIGTVAAKEVAYAATGAHAVDMESSAVAQVAEMHGLPFIAVRVIVDTAGDVLPRAVVTASRAGQVQMWRLLGGLLLSPADVAPLIRLALRYRVAMHSLETVAGLGKLAPPAIDTASGVRLA